MLKPKNSILAFAALALLTGSTILFTPTSASAQVMQKLTTSAGGIAFEVVGQVTNFPPTAPGQPATSHQYGYLSFINGLGASQIFSTADATLQNESTAHFTFFTDAITERVISNGRLRIVNRTGTTTIYFNQTPPGNFANRDTFRSGTPVLIMNYRQHVILDIGEAVPGLAGTGTFTVMNLLAVTRSEVFEIGGERYQLGKPADQFRQFYSGAPPAAVPPSGVFAGYAVAIDPAEPN